MPRRFSALTDAVIRETRPAAQPIRLPDGASMYMLVEPNGSRTWRFDYVFADEHKSIVLGEYPEVTLTEARARRAAAHELLAQGHDPVTARWETAGMATARMQKRLLETIAAVSELLLSDADDQALMQHVCTVLIRDGLFRMAWIGMVAADGISVRSVAQAGFADDYLDNIDIRCDESPAGQGPTGTAIREGKTVVNNDTETNRQFALWRERARLHGYRSSAAAPIRRASRIVGALNVYSSEPHAFDSDEILLLDKLAADLGIALERRESERALRESEAMFRLLLESSPEAIFGVDTAGICTFVNPACLRMLGYERESDLVGKSLHPLIHHSYPDGSPYPREQCHLRLSTLQGQPTHVDDEVHWRADGTSFPVEYWSRPMYRDGQLIGAVVNFVDITERKRSEQALRDSEERYRQISSVTSDLLYSCKRADDGNFRIDWATATVDRMFGYSLDDILQQGCWRCYVHPDDIEIFDRNITRLEPGESSVCELRIIAKDGSTRYIRAHSRVESDRDAVPTDRKGHRLYGSCQDVTERRQAEDALRDSETRFRAMAEQSADWVWAIDATGRHTYTNNNGLRWLGYDLDPFLCMDPTTLVHPDDRQLFAATFAAAVAERTGWRNVVLRWRCRDGSYRVFESNSTALFDEAGRLVGFQGIDRDITERRIAEERIEFLAHHDVLTGLPNRILLRDRFEQALHIADRVKTHVAILFLDLDNFKIVNDTLGHASGDKLLQGVVSRINRCMRDADTACRQGGDEFILLLSDIPGIEAAERVASDILSQLTDVFEVDGHLLNISCSIGISLYPQDGRDFDTLLQKADAAMYNAKEAGRNAYRFFSKSMNQRAREHMLLQSRMHQALIKGEFTLEYQPQVEIAGGRVFGVEALLRWNSAELGAVPPSRFIPVAEDSGFIVTLGAWVLEQACRQMREWQNAGLPELVVSVNLSALQFRRGNLIETVAMALKKSGLPPRLLELELTESILLQNVDVTLATVQQLNALGVRLAIDDFGTGYSSLSYLKRFTVDKLKIDQSFVRDIGTDPDDAAIVRAIIQMAKSLRLGIIAEGVETEEQLEFLRREGCKEIQGYYFSRPLPANQFHAFLGARLTAPRVVSE